jgi:hydrogenase maturation factor
VCLAIPARLIEAEGERGLVELGGVTRQVSLVLLPEAQVDEEEAEATLRLLTEIAQSEEAEV